MAIPGINKKAISIDLAIKIASEQFAIKKEVLLSKKRDRHVVEVRQLLFYVLRTKYFYSSVEIGRFFNKDHASVLYGTKVINDMLTYDLRLRHKLNQLTSIL